MNDYLPIIVGVILVMGFLLLLVALQAPLIALLGTVVSLLSTGAAFGVAKLIFQDGHGASLLGFTAQGFLDGWGPVFFFAMIFAIAMDYTVFLLATAKEHYEKSGDPHTAQIDGMAHSGRVIFAAAAVMARCSSASRSPIRCHRRRWGSSWVWRYCSTPCSSG